MADASDPAAFEAQRAPRWPTGSQLLGLVVLLIALGIAVFALAGDWYADPAGPTAFPSPGSSATEGVETASPGPSGAERRSIGSGVGVDWTTLVTFPGASVSDITAGGPGWIAVGAEGAAGCEICPSIETYTAKIWSSVDGQTWDEVQVPSPQGTKLSHVASGPGGLVALGWHDTDPVPDQDVIAIHVLVSEDGESWTRIDPPAFATTATAVNDLAGGSIFVAVGQTHPEQGGLPTVWTSVDGRDWQAVIPPAENGWMSSLAQTDAGWVAVGAATRPVSRGRQEVPFPVVWQSTDAQSWIPEDLPRPASTGGGSPQAILRAAPGLIVIGDAEYPPLHPPGPIVGFAAWRSGNYVTWEAAPVTDDFLENVGGGIVLYQAGGRVFAISSGCRCGTGWPGRWWTTADGLAWTEHQETPPILYSVVPFSGGLLGVGLVDGDGAILISE